MIRPLRIRREARRDVRFAAAWYEEQRPGEGLRFLLEIARLLERIADSPSQFPEIDKGVQWRHATGS